MINDMLNPTNVDATVHCAKCGGLLTSSGACLNCETHISKPESESPDASRVANPFTAAPETGPIPLPGVYTVPSVPPTVCFVIGAQTVEVPFNEEVTVGRIGKNSANKQPGVDLSAFDAEHKGVSRLHVRLQWHDGLIFITDLNSTNGTRLNGRRLVGGSERPLRDGDKLHLGSLQMIVKFEIA